MNWKYGNVDIEFNLFDPYHRHMVRQSFLCHLGIQDFWAEPIRSTSRKLLATCKQPVIIDVGANIGTFSLPIAREFPDSTVYAVEPHPVPGSVLFRNIATNNLQNVVQVSAAISSRAGLVQIYNCPTNSGGHRLSGFHGREDMSEFTIRSFSVPSVSLYDVFNKFDIKMCDLLKIDIEGLEYDALVSLGSLLHPAEGDRGVRAVIAEYGSEGLEAAGTSPQEVWHLMNEKGYKCEILQSGKKILSEKDIPILPKFFVVDFLFYA